MEEFLSNTYIDYNLSRERYYKILSDIQTEIRENLNTIKRLTKMDFEYNKKIINFTEIEKIIEKNKENEIINKKELNRIIFSYYGNPYITIVLCLKAIATQTKIVLATDDFMLGFNIAIVKIINQVISEYRLPNLINIKNQVKTEELSENMENIDKIICIGNKNKYELYLSKKIEKLIFIPFNNVDLYCSSSEFNDLKDMIYQYTYENEIEMEIYDDISLEEAIKEMNDYGNRDICVLLSNDENEIKLFKETVKVNKIFINQNPFKEEGFEIENKYFL